MKKQMKDNKIIDTFLHPTSVAVIGASKNLRKGGYRILNNLISNGFNGNIYPINPNASGEIFGLEFKKNIKDVEDDIDLAIFYVPNRVIPEILQDCIEKKVKGALIEASGFEEIGSEGLELKDEIVEITENFSKIRVVGPNCMGLTTIDESSDSPNKGGFFSSFLVFNEYKLGNIAIISQSGMLNGGYFTHLVQRYPGLGFRYVASIGNKMDISELEFLEYFIKDDSVNVIAIYLESFKNPRKFIELCREAKKYPKKTIILVKGGLTKQGQKATVSHTAAISESEDLTEALIKQAGIIKANSFFELFEYARTFSMISNSNKKLPEKGNLSIIVGSGGAGTILTDLTVKYGFELPELSKESYSILEEIFPTWMPPNKFALVDIWPAMEKAITTKRNPNDVMRSAFKAVLSEPKIEGLINFMFCSRQFRALSSVDVLIDTVKNYSKPVFFFLIGEEKELKYVTNKLSENNIPSFSNLESIVKNFRALLDEAHNKSKN